MTVALPSPRRRFPARDLPEVVDGARPEVLADVHREGVALAIWRRRLPTGLAAWLRALDPGHLPDGRVLVHTRDLAAALTAMMDESALSDTPARRCLIDDMVDLGIAFAGVMSTRIVDLRLEAVRDNACWKFHRDRVTARLLTTYRGPGTQWVFRTHADRALAEQSAYRGPTGQLPTGSVGLFKGDLAPDGAGMLHRSPPIATTGTTRLLLCINPPSDASPGLWEPDP